MPPPKKIDLIPEELRVWLKEELKERGFSGYVELADALNERLEASGLEMRVGKSAVHNFGQEYEAFAKAEAEASAWAVSWMEDNGLEDEAKRHNVLFQMITTLAFKVMKSQMTKEGDQIDPQQLHFLGRLMKDVMSSSGMREKMSADNEKRIADRATAAAKAEVADDLTKNGKSYGLTRETIEKIKAGILQVPT
jgi:hypothetical protein